MQKNSFENSQVKATLTALVATNVMRKEKNTYTVEEDFDLIFRGRVVRRLKQGIKGEEALMGSLVETLAEYDVFKQDGISLENELLVRTVLTFASEKITKIVLASNNNQPILFQSKEVNEK